MQVCKFGGASVRDAASVKNVLSILRSFANEPTIVVVSAMGKVTNLLEKLTRAYFLGEGEAAKWLQELRQYHAGIAAALFDDPGNKVFDEMENIYVELSWAIEEEPAYSFDHHYDQIVSQGELLCTKIISAYLTQEGIVHSWLDARDLIQTDNTYREGVVDYELSQSRVDSILLSRLKEHGMIITQGFIGGTSENFTTTLGREGSDYSAALFAYFTDAKKVTIWKDVPGVLSADPKVFEETTSIQALSYHDAIELAYYGATVIHPKTIKPLQNKNIPLYVRSFTDPGHCGTVVSDEAGRTGVTSYIVKEAQLLISIMPNDFSFIAEENLSEIFRLFSEHHARINMMQNSALSFSVCTDDNLQKTMPLMEGLKTNFRVLYNRGVKLFTIRNYEQDSLEKIVSGQEVLLEQRSRHTLQAVVQEKVATE